DDLLAVGATSNVLRLALRSTATLAGLTGLAHNSAGLIVGTITDTEAKEGLGILDEVLTITDKHYTG
ncbi:MAG: hypothetical protein VW082_00550, partial [Candidatus Nanopelagicales bacterium]